MPLSRTVLSKVAITKTTPLPHVSSPPAVVTNSTLTHVLGGRASEDKVSALQSRYFRRGKFPLFPVLDPQLLFTTLFALGSE